MFPCYDICINNYNPRYSSRLRSPVTCGVRGGGYRLLHCCSLCHIKTCQTRKHQSGLKSYFPKLLINFIKFCSFLIRKRFSCLKLLYFIIMFWQPQKYFAINQLIMFFNRYSRMKFTIQKSFKVLDYGYGTGGGKDIS